MLFAAEVCSRPMPPRFVFPAPFSQYGQLEAEAAPNFVLYWRIIAITDANDGRWAIDADYRRRREFSAPPRR